MSKPLPTKLTVPLYNQISEKVFTAQIIRMAQMFGWMTAHFRPGKQGSRYVTAVQGDGVGFPDLVLIKPGRVIFSELKSEKGRLTPGQSHWLDVAKAAGVEAYVWRPSMINEIERQLR